MIRLHFTPFLGHQRSRASLQSNSQYEWTSGKTILASVANFSYFMVGSLWTGGAPEEYPDYEQLTFDVDVQGASTTLYRAYGRTPHDNPIIPRSYYRIPEPVSDGHVALFPMRGAFRGLIVPCSEIFRFYYFGISGKLGKALLDGTYLTHPKDLVNEDKSSWPDQQGEAYIRLGKYLDDADRLEMARITFSAVARGEASQLVTRAAAGDLGSRFPLIIRPPFEGPTRLVVRGKRIKIGKYWVFLAFKIEKCSAPMPFTHLGYNRQNPGNQGRRKPKDAKPAYRGSYRNAIQADGQGPPKFTQAADPSSKDAPHQIEGMLSRDRYTAAFTDALVDRGPIRCISASVYADVMATNALYSSGTGMPGSLARAASFSEGGQRDLSALLPNFKSTIALLPDAGPNVTIVSVEDQTFRKVAVPGDPLGPAWAFLDSYDRQVPRRAIVAIVAIASRYFAVIEIERRPKTSQRKHEEYFRTALLSSPSSRSITADDVRGILDALIVTRGVIGIDWRAGRFQSWPSDGLWHFECTNAARAAALYKALAGLGRTSQ
ncbi:MAG: hypothetical protein ACYDDQ_01930 [Vulcanimicrobiaceae bacterium]